MKPAGQMTVSLTSELEQFVREQTRIGAYASHSEYVRDLVRERYLQERDRTAKMQKLDEALAEGIADAEAGRVTPLDEGFQKLRHEFGLPPKSADK